VAAQTGTRMAMIETAKLPVQPKMFLVPLTDPEARGARPTNQRHQAACAIA
jgi:hypothetical protein